MQPILEVHGLSVRRGGLAVLEGLGFSLAKGEVLLLRGPNGIGKTTLIRTLAGLQPPAAGTVRRAEAVYAGHLDGVKSVLTVAENLRFWAAVMGGGSIDAALDAFGLSDLAHRPARSLSAGQKRRLGLSRLLLSDRPLWLLDEPTVSLDTASVARFAEVLEAHLTKGGAAVIASHGEPSLPGRVLDLTLFRAKTPADHFGGDW